MTSINWLFLIEKWSCISQHNAEILRPFDSLDIGLFLQIWALFIWTHQICWFHSFLLIWAIFIDFRVHTAKSIDFNRSRPWAPTVCTLRSRFLPWAPPWAVQNYWFQVDFYWFDMKSTFLAAHGRPQPWVAEINKNCPNKNKWLKSTYLVCSDEEGTV